jgi:hypothetical protein
MWRCLVLDTILHILKCLLESGVSGRPTFSQLNVSDGVSSLDTEGDLSRSGMVVETMVAVIPRDIPKSRVPLLPEIPLNHDGPKSRHTVGGERVCTRPTGADGGIPVCLFDAIRPR